MLQDMTGSVYCRFGTDKVSFKGSRLIIAFSNFYNAIAWEKSCSMVAKGYGHTELFGNKFQSSFPDATADLQMK